MNCRKVLAGLEQMKVDYKLHFISYFKGEHKGDEYKKINPNATLPSAKYEDLTLTESVSSS